MSDSPSTSPRWNTPTKFLVALVCLALLGWLLLQFQSLWGPMIAVCIIAYLLSPVAGWVERVTRLPWAVAVTLVYLMVFTLIIVIGVVAGVAIQRQVVGLYTAVVNISGDLPRFLQELTSRPIAIGPFIIDPATVDVRQLLQPLTSAIQPALSQLGVWVSGFAAGTATGLGWFFFVLILSYYLLLDLRNVLTGLDRRVPEPWREDVRRLAASLGPIWNNYLRGQVTLSGTLGIMVGVTLSVLGVSYAPVLGIVAFVLDFIPYIGATLSLIIGTLVALFQGSNWLGLDPIWYAVLVGATYLILQQIQGYVFWPRIMGVTFNLHPVVIIVGALMLAQLMGVVGLMLAAPLIATLVVFGRYVFRKLFDLDPWDGAPLAMRPARISPLARLRSIGFGRRPQLRHLQPELRQTEPSQGQPQ
ncbi:MAG: AI-2E family transporter [Anaerolineales bacterium]|nr:AI-2E family transporter [Anaerolineales bacterium]